MRRTLVICVVACLLAASGWAQKGSRGRPRRGDEAFKMVVAYLLSNLEEGLELSEQEYLQLLPLVKTRQNHRREFQDRRRQALRELRRLIPAGGDEARLGELLDELRAVDREQAEVLARDLEAIDAKLTTVQQARYRLMEMDVERRVRELAGSIGRRRSGREAPRRE